MIKFFTSFDVVNKVNLTARKLEYRKNYFSELGERILLEF